jgi:hypothetical protein
VLREHLCAHPHPLRPIILRKAGRPGSLANCNRAVELSCGVFIQSALYLFNCPCGGSPIPVGEPLVGGTTRVQRCVPTMESSCDSSISEGKHDLHRLSRLSPPGRNGFGADRPSTGRSRVAAALGTTGHRDCPLRQRAGAQARITKRLVQADVYRRIHQALIGG